MKRKLLVLFFGFLLFVSCKQTSSNHIAEIPALQEETEEISLTDEQKREVYLRSLMDAKSTLLEDEKIESDLLNILQGLQEKDEAQKIVPTLQKVDNNLFGLSDVSFFSVDGEEIKEDIKLSLYKLYSGEKSGFAITCNDLRIGEILVLVEEGEFDGNDPFIKLVSSNIKAYINETIENWHELKKKKGEEYAQRSVWEGLVTSEEYEYEKWKVNSKSSPRFLLKTQWDQDPIYNDVIVKLKGGEFPADCATVAIAQIMAYHQYPNNYYGTNWESFNNFKNKLVKHFPFAEEWNGKYDWWLLTWETKAEDIGEDYPIYRLQIASLMYEIAESCDASYSEEGTSIYTENFAKGLLSHDYITGVCTKKTPMPEEQVNWNPELVILPPWVKLRPPTYATISNTKLKMKDNNELKSVGPKGNRIRYECYSFDSVKSSIDNLCPVLIRGTAINKKTDTDGKETFKKAGHAWVVDGYCNLTCDAVHKKTKERKTITADYVHCNPGWGGNNNGYYISNVFTFGLEGGAIAKGNRIRSSSWPCSNKYYKYELTIFPNLIPKSKLGIYSKHPWNYHWEALW